MADHERQPQASTPDGPPAPSPLNRDDGSRREFLTEAGRKARYVVPLVVSLSFVKPAAASGSLPPS